MPPAGVVDEVVDHLPEAGIVPEHGEGWRPAAFEIQGDGDAVVMALVGHVDDGREQLCQIDRLRFVALHFGVEPAGVRNVGDQPVEPFHVVLNHR